MKNEIILIISLIVTLFSGCTTHQVEPAISMKGPAYVENSSCNTAVRGQNRSYNEGSIYGRGANPLFSDKKAMGINDIVTVVISENTFQSSQGNKKISDNSAQTLGGGVFTGRKNGSGIGSKIANTLNGMTDVGFKTNSNSTFSGSGTQSRNEKFNTTISARVVKILNNGNYFIDGSRSLLLNGTKQMIRITGVIRPYDIDQFNTINSKYMADAKIHYETEGDIKEATRRPWGARLVQSVWPF
jgi:flagellar L-ring protein precursor FlgH